MTGVVSPASIPLSFIVSLVGSSLFMITCSSTVVGWWEWLLGDGVGETLGVRIFKYPFTQLYNEYTGSHVTMASYLGQWIAPNGQLFSLNCCY